MFPVGLSQNHHDSLGHSSSQGAPAQPTDVAHPPVSFFHEPVVEGVYSSPTVHSSSGASWSPQPFQTGELDHYEETLEHGNSERETEDFMPPPPLPPYPRPEFQAGELSHHESIYEHGNVARETEDQGFSPLSPYEMSAASTSDSRLQPVPLEPRPFGPSLYNLFKTGQLPGGTYTQSLANYETGHHLVEAHWKYFS